jgi:hypothetical protein
MLRSSLGHYEAGKCPGAADVQCCESGSPSGESPCGSGSFPHMILPSFLKPETALRLRLVTSSYPCTGSLATLLTNAANALYNHRGSEHYTQVCVCADPAPFPFARYGHGQTMEA